MSMLNLSIIISKPAVILMKSGISRSSGRIASQLLTTNSKHQRFVPFLTTSSLSTFSGSNGNNYNNVRFLTTKKKSEKPDRDDTIEPTVDTEITGTPVKIDHDDDPFGIHFDDGADRLGPTLPPKYKRDVMTGKFTGIIEKELTDNERSILNADPIQKERILTDRIVKDWFEDNNTEVTIDDKLNQLGQRIRDTDMSLNVLGRSVKSQASYEKLEDGTQFGRDETGFTQHLTSAEFEAYQKYMKEEYSISNINEDDIPVISVIDDRKKTNQDNKRSNRNETLVEDDVGNDPDELELSLKWLTARAQRQMDDIVDDNPYSDLMPNELNPSKLVNRKRAKPIPVQLLHHNNVQLLHQFLTPTGQIQNRVQTRLGARDQRRVSKLIRRARAIGLLPYMGQSKIEQHGWIHAPDINESRDWEKELIERGLTIRRSNNKAEKKE